jgi:hypothetical protein
LQLKAGVVSADFKIVKTDYPVTISDTFGSTGTAIGMGLVFGSEQFRVHLLDYERYSIGREKFDVWSFSLLLLTELGR